MLTAFSESAKEKAGFYVYMLADPDSQEVFYIGKGSNNRVFEHEFNPSGQKLTRIIDIEERGSKVSKYIVHSGMTETEACAVEAALINLYSCKFFFPQCKLTNELPGIRTIAPCLDVYEYNTLFSRKSLRREDFPDELRMMLVNLKTTSRRSLADLDFVKKRLRSGATIYGNHEKPRIVLAVANSIIVDVYDVEDWIAHESTYKNGHIHTRYTFENLIRNDELCIKYRSCCVSALMKPNSRKLRVPLY